MLQKTVLAVEDDLLTAEVVRQCLEGAGHAVRLAEDGLEASRYLASEPPDLVLLDLMLPGMDGWELCTMIRTSLDPRLSAVPIVMLTSRGTAEDRLRGLKAGADDYITKPFSLEELTLKVGRLLTRSRPTTAARPKGEDRQGIEEVYDLLCHELNNHLIAISGFARRVDLEADTISRQTLKRYVGFIRQSADHLSSFLEDVLLFRNIRSGRLDFEVESMNLQEPVEDVLSLHARMARGKHITLRNKVGADAPAVRFSPHAAKICLNNLVENAVKYTQEGGTVTVRARPQEGARVVLEVEDTGPGVPSDEREKIFEKFYRGRKTRRSTKGTGLGLYVTRSVARFLDADVTLGEDGEAGSRFRLVFAAAK